MFALIVRDAIVCSTLSELDVERSTSRACVASVGIGAATGPRRGEHLPRVRDVRVSAFRIRVVGRHLDFWPDTHAQTVSQVSRFSASRAFLMTTPPADHSSGAHMSRRGVISSPLENRLLCPVVVGLPDEPRFPRVRAQRQTRAEATREATGERISSLFAQGAHSRRARPPAPAGGDESGWIASASLGRVPFRDLPSPAARVPSARDGRGVHVAEGVLRSVPGDRVSLRRPKSRAHSRRGCVPTARSHPPPVAASLSSPVVPRPRSPLASSLPPQPRSRREQNRGGAR